MLIWFLKEQKGGSLFNRQNLLSVLKVTCQWSLKGNLRQWIDMKILNGELRHPILSLGYSRKNQTWRGRDEDMKFEYEKWNLQIR